MSHANENRLKLSSNDRKSLEALFSSPEFQSLEANNQFANSFELNTPTETDHCRILAWLLDPTETHGLGTKCLAALYSAAKSANESATFFKSLSLAALLQTAQGVQVVCEQPTHKGGRVDLVVYGVEGDWAIVIEVKYGAKLMHNQLEGYSEWIEQELIPNSDINADKVLRVYLDRWLAEPLDEPKNWISLSYEWLWVMLAPEIESGRVHREQQKFLADYIGYCADDGELSAWYPNVDNVAPKLVEQNFFNDMQLAAGVLRDINSNKRGRHQSGMPCILAAPPQDRALLTHLYRNRFLIEELESYSGAYVLGLELQKLYPGLEVDPHEDFLDLRLTQWRRFGDSEDWPVKIQLYKKTRESGDSNEVNTFMYKYQIYFCLDMECCRDRYVERLSKIPTQLFKSRAKTNLRWTLDRETDFETSDVWPRAEFLEDTIAKLTLELESILSST